MEGGGPRSSSAKSISGSAVLPPGKSLVTLLGRTVLAAATIPRPNASSASHGALRVCPRPVAAAVPPLSMSSWVDCGANFAKAPPTFGAVLITPVPTLARAPGPKAPPISSDNPQYPGPASISS